VCVVVDGCEPIYYKLMKDFSKNDLGLTCVLFKRLDHETTTRSIGRTHCI